MVFICAFKFTCRCTSVPAKRPKADGHLHLLSTMLFEAGTLAEVEYTVLASLASSLARGICLPGMAGMTGEPPWSPSMCVALAQVLLCFPFPSFYDCVMRRRGTHGGRGQLCGVWSRRPPEVSSWPTGLQTKCPDLTIVCVSYPKSQKTCTRLGLAWGLFFTTPTNH